MELCVEKSIDDIEDLIGSRDSVPRPYRSNITFRSRKNKKNDYIRPTIHESPVPESHKIYIKTWGCTHNSSDSEYMAGLLSSYGYNLVNNAEEADLWLLNSCTVKDPAESHFRNEIERAQKLGKHIVAAGCVPQGAPKLNYIKNLSIIGIHNIDRVVEVVEETLKGHSVRLFGQKKENGKKLGGAALLLPKVRKNPYIEIIPISTGCLNQCTYCKTKHARGELGSYPVQEIVDRAKQAFSEGVVELWLTSEDTGAYGKDIGTSLPELLWKVIEVIPDNCRMRVGMTNPPYILEHLEEMAKILSHKKVYSFLHVPVQSGSDPVLADMKREYTIADFKHVVDFLRLKVPGITIATDIICGFPTETEKDFEETVSLCSEYKFPSLFINQFYPRPGTPAAKMTRIPTQEVKKRTKIISDLFQSYETYSHKLNTTHEVLVTEVAHDNNHFVGHNKFYEQVLVPKNEKFMGKILRVFVTDTKKHCLIGQPIGEGHSPAIAPIRNSKSSVDSNEKSFKSMSYSLLLVVIAILFRLLWLFFQN